MRTVVHSGRWLVLFHKDTVSWTFSAAPVRGHCSSHRGRNIRANIGGARVVDETDGWPWTDFLLTVSLALAGHRLPTIGDNVDQWRFRPRHTSCDLWRGTRCLIPVLEICRRTVSPKSPADSQRRFIWFRGIRDVGGVCVGGCDSPVRGIPKPLLERSRPRCTVLGLQIPKPIPARQVFYHVRKYGNGF